MRYILFIPLLTLTHNASGQEFGNKVKAGDMRTTERGCVFSVREVVSSSHWQHDFNDGKG